MKLAITQINRLGNRDKNEDRLVVVERDGAVLIVVADGMGGHRGGEIAAQILVDTVERQFRVAELPIRQPRKFLGKAITAAHKLISKQGRSAGADLDPRTTCVVCLLQDGGATWAHVGDSRLYLLRGNRILARTIDHSYVEELYRQGMISESDMLTHPKRSYLTQCIGGQDHKLDISYGSIDKFATEDVMLLCTDGLWSAVSEQELRGIIAKPDLEVALNQLATRAETNSYPQSDNISAIALRVLDLTDASASTNRQADATEAAGNAQGDHLSNAVDTINQALEDYRGEMDYDPGSK